MKVAFYAPILCVRGSSVALYDYAHYNETLLGNQSVIVVPKEGLEKSDLLGIIRFAKRFQILPFSDLETVLQEAHCDVLYCIKYGTKDGIFSKRIKTVIHCVFDMSEPHGNVYAGVSQTLARKFGRELFVPHMVSLRPDTSKNLRQELAIPSSAVVFGRYGGMDTFDLTFCHNAISRVLKEKSDRYFLFINTPHFLEHPRIIYREKITEEKDKNAFISTCDAHLECGSLGHTFGLAIAEFNIHNKPIIVYKSPTLWNTAHLEILGVSCDLDRSGALGASAIYFSNEEEFYTILSTFIPYKARNCYSEYTPDKVMDRFNTIFLK